MTASGGFSFLARHRIFLVLSICAVFWVALPGVLSATVPVRFELMRPGAQSVHLRGTFNDWTEGIDILSDEDGDGVWALVKPLDQGEIEYKFFVNGNEWLADPANPRQVGPFGNSALVVSNPMIYNIQPVNGASFRLGQEVVFGALVAWEAAGTLDILELTRNGSVVPGALAGFDAASRRLRVSAGGLSAGEHRFALTVGVSEPPGLATQETTITVRAEALEHYFDQFDFGVQSSDLNWAFWAGGTGMSYQPDATFPPNQGRVRLGANGDRYSDLVTWPFESSNAEILEVRTRVRLTSFEPGAGERNAEVAIRSNGTDGYLLTLDAGNGQIRLRRRGGGYTDLVAPAAHAFSEGSSYYVYLSTQGVNPVTIRAQVAADEGGTSGTLLFDATHVESEWLPTGRSVGLQGYVDQGPFAFDFDYFAAGEVGYAHPASYWERSGYTGAPPEPTSSLVGDLDRYTVDEDSLVLHSGEVQVVLTPRLEGTVRVEVIPPGDSPSVASYAVTRTTWPEVPFRVIDGDPLVLEADGWRVEASRSPLKLRFLDADGNVFFGESPDARTGAIGESRTVAFGLGVDEPIFGLGQPPYSDNVGLNRRGHTYSIRNQHIPPSVLLFPVWLSPRGYGVYIDNPSFASLSIGDTTPDRIVYTSQAGDLVYYVMMGDTMADVVDEYTQVTGRPALAPRWTLGNIQSKYGYRSFAEIQSIIDGFESRDIPLDGVVMDLDWFGISTMGNLEFQQTPEWANPVQGMAALRSQGYRFIPITEPQMSGFSFNAAETLSLGLVGMGPDRVTPLPGQNLGWITNSAPVYLLDFTNPATRGWWKTKHRRLIEDYAFDGFWQDLNEPEGLPSNMEFHDGPANAVANVLAINMNRSLVEAMAEYRPGARPFIMSRSGSPGMQKYGASVWSGDVSATWGALEDQVQLAQSMGLVGVPYWNSDIGGFNGTPSPELYLRWCQFGLFNPLYRPHGAQSDREPWRFGSTVESQVREVIRLRYRLLPHYYTVAREAYDTGMPMMRPLVMDWPDDPAVWNLDGQFLYGSSLLVRPVVEQGATEVTVYHPEGTWIDWFTGSVITGPANVATPVSAGRFPLSVRTPVILPLAPAMNRSDAAPLSPVELQVFWTPDQTQAEGKLYEDDGLTTAYQQTGFAFTTFAATRTGQSVQLSIAAASGTFDGQLTERVYTVEVPMAPVPESVAVNGTQLPRFADNSTPQTAGWSAVSGNKIRVRTGSLSTASAHVINLGELPGRSGWVLE